MGDGLGCSRHSSAAGGICPRAWASPRPFLDHSLFLHTFEFWEDGEDYTPGGTLDRLAACCWALSLASPLNLKLCPRLGGWSRELGLVEGAGAIIRRPAGWKLLTLRGLPGLKDTGDLRSSCLFAV